MFAVNIALGSIVWRLLFKDEEKANAAYGQMTTLHKSDFVELEDDFGQKLTVFTPSIHGLMFEDLDKSKMANVELFLHQSRVQNMATKAAQSDPGLKASSLMNGPRMLDPMGGMPRN